jgi:hypothetical protein
MDLGIGDQEDIASPPTVTAVRASERHMLLSSEPDATVATGTRPNLDSALV